MHTLAHLFEPRGVAVVGASVDLSPGGQPVRALNRFGFRGVHPVNPKYAEIDGLRCCASVADIQEPCDLALVAMPPEASIDAVRTCGQAGIKFCAVLSAGFRETGAEGATLEAGLRKAAGEAGIRGALDVDALAEAIARVSILAARKERIAEIDINPLFVRPRGRGVVATDALIVTSS